MSNLKVPIDDLRPGMFIAKLDLSWFRSPFMRHSFLIEDPAQIDKLRRVGVQFVDIDPDRSSIPPDGTTDQTRSHAANPIRQTVASQPQVKTLQQLAEEIHQARIARKQLEEAVRSVFSTISRSGTVGPHQARDAVQEITIAARTLSNSAMFMALSQNRDGDASLSQHALSTCTLALVLGQTYGFNPLELNELATAGLLHDIGLLQIPESVLKRTTTTSHPLTPRERERFQSHPRLSIAMLEQQKGFATGVLHLIGEHHALLDGSGYPQETRGEFTSDRTRILVISDRYDELITGFGGATPLAPYQALQRLYREAQEGKLDKDILSRFIKTVGIYPIHSYVRLNTKELAIVTDLNPSRLHQPIVTITHEPGGNSYPAPFTINLALQDTQPPGRTIEAVLDATSAPPFDRPRAA
jgi:HD-GYP domain-containing protein (c-di-GMP phosphodiesterase class II)